jgi:curved DNA-binding protein CbpA
MFVLDLGIPSHYSTLGIAPNATVSEIGEARSKLRTSIQQKLIDTQDEDQRKALEEQLKTINAAGEVLSRPEKRKEYDQLNQHLRFYMDRPAAAPIFNSKVERLFLLHRVLREHLAEKGCQLSPLCDLDRDDFSTDETPNRLLDGLLGD